MWKKVLFVLLCVVSVVALSGSIACADEVIAKLVLDKPVTKYKSIYMGTTFEQVRVALNIANLSDRIQTITLKPKYHFWLLKASPRVKGLDPATFMPIVAEGDLEATYGKGYPVISISPHSEMQQAYGALPDAITARYTYKGYLLPGTYIIRVEVPTGLPGCDSHPTTEAVLVIAP